MKSRSIQFALGLLAVISASAVAQQVPDKTGFAQQMQPFLKKHCFKCHGPDKQKSRIRFDKLTTYRPEDGALWTKVHEASARLWKKRDRPRAESRRTSSVSSGAGS